MKTITKIALSVVACAVMSESAFAKLNDYADAVVSGGKSINLV